MTQILIIEDDADLLFLLQSILELHQFTVRTAENGAQGLEQILREHPDLIICDVDMPRLDGFSLLAWLQHNAPPMTIPFMFMTGRSDRQNMRQGMELGADDYLVKPFSESELLGAISAQLSKKATLKQLEVEQKQKLDRLKNQIITTLPHEFNTPLNGILLSLGFMQEELEQLTHEEIRELLEAIRCSTQRLHHLTKNFLLYAQLEIVNSDPERRKAFCAATMLSSPANLFADVARQRAIALNRGTDLTIQCPSEVGDTAIRITDSLWITVAEELIDNALKFSAPGSPVKISCVRDENWLILQISNQGQGMRPDQITNIGACNQFDRAIYGQQGAGLGLIITKRIVELHGGHLSIQSVPEQQTMVSVKIPLTEWRQELSDQVEEHFDRFPG